MAVTREYQAGFELNTTEELSSVASATISNTKAKTGTYSLRFSGTQTATVTLTSTAQKRLAFHINHAGAASGSPYICRLLTGGSSQVLGLRFNSGSNLIEVLDDAGVLASAALGDLALTDTWGILGFDFKIDASGWATVYYNGVQIINFTGDTNDGGAAVDTLAFGTPSGSWTASVYVDDVYVDDTVGEGAAAIPPDYRYHLVTPNGNGGTQQWDRSSGANNYEMVDEIPHDSDTTYISTDVDGEKDYEAMTTYTLGVGESIISVIGMMEAKKVDGASGVQARINLHDGSNEDAGTLQNLSTSYTLKRERFLLAPDGGAWTQTDLDNLQVGAEINV